jgi:hypothetical protein
MANATIKQVMEYFGFTSAGKFMQEWKLFSPADQEQLKAGIGDGSLTY